MVELVEVKCERGVDSVDSITTLLSDNEDVVVVVVVVVVVIFDQRL